MLYKHPCGLYVEDSDQWELDQFRQDAKAKGDIIYNTCRKIIDDNDCSEWAYRALEICAELLYERKRWPDEFNHPNDAKNINEYIISKLFYDAGDNDWRLYRPQTNMTRDPWIYWIALCVHLNRRQFIEVVTIPFYLYLNSPTTWVWRRFLITGKGKRLYEFLELSQLWMHKKEYTLLLVKYRAMAAGVLRVLNKLNLKR